MLMPTNLEVGPYGWVHAPIRRTPHAGSGRPAHVPVAKYTGTMDPGISALGTWSGGRFMHFGEPLDDERLVALLRPDAAIATVITADVYGSGDADRMLGRALESVA